MPNAESCVVLGAGGHAKVLIDCIQAAKSAHIVGVLDVDRQMWGKTILDVTILGGDEMLGELLRSGVQYFAVGLGSVGDTSKRSALFRYGLNQGSQPMTVIHPSVTCSQWTHFGQGVQILAGSIINAGVVLGDNVIVNSGAVVEHDCVIGDHVHIATGAKIAGSVRVGNGCHIGAGAVIRQGITIGEGSIVGAGAAVVKDVPSDVVVVGVPARNLIRRSYSP